MPVNEESYEITKEQYQQGITNANEQIERAVKGNISKAKALHVAIKATHKSVLGYTLYIPENLVDSKITALQFKESYPGKFSFVDEEKFNNVIAAKATKTAYLMVNMRPMGGKIKYYHTIVDAATNKTLALFAGKGLDYYTPGVIQPAITKKSIKSYESEFVK